MGNNQTCIHGSTLNEIRVVSFRDSDDKENNFKCNKCSKIFSSNLFNYTEYSQNTILNSSDTNSVYPEYPDDAFLDDAFSDYVSDDVSDDEPKYSKYDNRNECIIDILPGTPDCNLHDLIKCGNKSDKCGNKGDNWGDKWGYDILNNA